LKLKAYAGIGSRETPYEILQLMKNIGYWMAKRDWLLRSGGAIGADLTFERGCDLAQGEKEILRPEDSTPEAEELASRFHPAWERCTGPARKLHGRNMMIVSGRKLVEPVEMVICWTKDGKSSGGTGQPMRYSDHLKIPTFNLFFTDVREAILRQIRG
jgi:hypothetical protein